jgi:hypothetical protein
VEKAVKRALLAIVVLSAAIAFPMACKTSSDGEIGAANDPHKPDKHGGKKHGKVPKQHRESAPGCSTAKVAGDVDVPDAGSRYGGTQEGSCKKDSDCTQGKNGRCAFTGGGRMAPRPACVYDACFSDADCGGKVECACFGSPGAGNYCMGGNCATDDDCGKSYCSPSFGTSCGAYGGVVGNFCHTDDDECTNDDECRGESTEKQNGFCAFIPEAKKWKCSYAFCVG